jgi:hypothetical protein
MTFDSRTSGWIVRLAVLLLLGGWIVFSPAYRQVFDGKSTWAPRWVMFHGFGRNVCDVRFFEMVEGPEGSPHRQKIDRFDVLDKERDWLINKSLVRMDSRTDVEKVGRKLCRKMGSGVDVRALARCGSRGRWIAKLNGKTNLCTTQSKIPRFGPSVFK